MWRLSDEALAAFESALRESYELAAREAENLDVRWLELPEAKEGDVFGVDGSRGIEKFSGAVFYAISSVAVGSYMLEMHDVTILKPHMHIEDRIRLHMQTSEFRIGSFVDAGIVLMDGTLSGALVRPPAYVNEVDLNALRRSYDLDDLIADFVSLLDDWSESLRSEVESGEARGNNLLARRVFEKFERGYRRGAAMKDDLIILMEYVEYLHALDELLSGNVVFVAKSFYTRNLCSVGDALVLELLSTRQFGEPRSGYVPFRQRVRKAIPFAELFKNVSKAEIFSAYARLADGENILLLESPREISDDVLAMIRAVEVHGYPLPLIHAHRYATIKRGELKRLIEAIINATDPRYSLLLRRPRDVLE